MVKLSKKQIKRYLNFLGENKCLIGLSDWTIILHTHTDKLGTKTLATVSTDIWEKELNVTVTEDFLKKSIQKQNNILLHELIHVRIRYFRERVSEFESIEEEHLVNDLTRGFEKIGKLEL